MARTAQEIIQSVGTRKSTTNDRLRRDLGGALSAKRKNAADARTLCRAVMRHPDQDVIDQLEFARKIAAEQFSDMDNAQLKWLLNGSAHASRGGFEVGEDGQVTDKGVSKFREFLNIPSYTLTHKPQSLITRMETLCAAIGYRSTDSNVPGKILPSRYATEAEKADEDYDITKYMDGHENIAQTYNKVRALTCNKLVPAIGDFYTDRATDNILTDSVTGALISESPEGDMLEGLPADISDASDVEESEAQPHARAARRLFRKKKGPDELSWIGSADAANIPIRHHISGSVSVSLAALDAICSSGQGPLKHWLDDDNNLRKISGAFVIATYDRGDFHTIAETGAGAEYYREARAKQNASREQSPSSPLPEIRHLTPIEALTAGLDMMTLAITDAQATTAMPASGEMTLREAFREQSQALLDHSIAQSSSIDPCAFSTASLTSSSIDETFTHEDALETVSGGNGNIFREISPKTHIDHGFARSPLDNSLSTGVEERKGEDKQKSTVNRQQEGSPLSVAFFDQIIPGSGSGARNTLQKDFRQELSQFKETKQDQDGSPKPPC